MREAGVPERASPAARLFHGSEPRKRADGRTKSAILNTGIDPSRVTGEDMREAGISERDFHATRRLAPGCRFITHKACFQSSCKSQLPHKSVNLSFTITNTKNKLTDLCGS